MAIDVFQPNIFHEGKAHFVRFRAQHKATRVAIEAMDDAETVLLALHVAKVFLAAVRDKRIHERIAVMAFRRMTHQSRLLRDNEQIVVLVANVERNIGRDELGRVWVFIGLVFQHVAHANRSALARQLAVERAVAIGDAFRSGAARGIQPLGSHIGVKAHALAPFRHHIARVARHGHPPYASRANSPQRAIRNRRSRQYRQH